MVTLKVNGEQHDLDIETEMPLLWALRTEIGLVGTKYGCGIAQCGACTVLMDGRSVPARCRFPGRKATRSPPSKVFPRMARSTRCSRPGSQKTCRNAAIVS